LKKNLIEFVSFDKLRTNGIGTITRVLSVAFTTEPDEVSGRTGEIILAVNISSDLLCARPELVEGRFSGALL